MIIPLDKLISYKGNRYIFTKASMVMVDKLDNIPEYPDGEDKWKVVPHILNIALNEKVKYILSEEERD